MPQTAAQLLVATLDAHGIDLVYCVPGESYLAVTDALIDYPHIRQIVCRHEAGAGFMAYADGHLRDKPGVLFVSRGPGGSNAAVAIHSADHDAVPMVLFIGNVGRKEMGRKCLQEVNWAKTYSDMAKMVIEVNDPALVAEATARAFHVAQAGTPGPVVVALAGDMLDEVVDAPVLGPRPLSATVPTPADVARVAEMLRTAERPVVIAGGMLKGGEALAALARFAEAWSLPICPTHRRASAFDGLHPNYGGYLGLRSAEEQMAALAESDLVLALGERLSHTITQVYSFPAAPKPAQPLIHVWPDANEVGRNWEPTLGLGCDAHAFIEAIMAEGPAKAPAGRKAWIARLNEIHRRVTRWEPASSNDGVVFGTVVAAIGERLAADAVVTADAGSFMSWVQRYLHFKPSHHFIGTTVGAMGAAVPAVVAAGLREPGRQLVGFVGDGGMLMTGNELATAMQYDVPVKIFVANNSSYGTIRLHQETRYPGRVSATDLRNPDFAAVAEGFGARGLRIENDADVEPVVEEAMACAEAVVVEVRTSLSHLSCWTRIEDLTAAR